MTPHPDVSPALTPEEWASKRTQIGYWGEAQLHSTGELLIRDNVDPPAMAKGRQSAVPQPVPPESPPHV